MNFFYRAPDNQLIGESGNLTETIKWNQLKEDVPPFAVDVLVLFAGCSPDDDYSKILLRYGRPVLRVGSIDSDDLPLVMEEYRAHLGTRARSNYQPVDCNFYDNFEAAITRQQPVKLEYLDANGKPVSESTLLRDLKTHLTEEYVQLASGTWLRLDRILAVDGTAAGASCRF